VFSSQIRSRLAWTTKAAVRTRLPDCRHGCCNCNRSTVAPTALSKGRSLGQNPRIVAPPSRKPQEQFARNGKRSTGFSFVPEADSATETPARPPCTGGRAQALRAQAEIILRKERTVTAADGNGSHAQDETEKQATDELEQIAPEGEGRWPPDQVAAVDNLSGIWWAQRLRGNYFRNTCFS
jgi:hypothetical protein